MPKLKLSSLNLDTLQSVVDIQERPIDDYPWLVTDHVTLSPDDEQQLQAIVRRLRRSSTNLLNEATVWGKAIFPLLLLAEHNSIEAWALSSSSSFFLGGFGVGLVPSVCSDNFFFSKGGLTSGVSFSSMNGRKAELILGSRQIRIMLEAPYMPDFSRGFSLLSTAGGGIKTLFVDLLFTTGRSSSEVVVVPAAAAACCFLLVVTES